ncbi:BspA family leucine-rich repeat surface protein [Mycoplasma capricolum subsp. capripneumoniae]|uniref:BspA family leucine-rich repeat surface protein n=1 Tax=Mycoplasma capricolum TaxID=2095 RepID=UPI00140521A9|nr:BspA family leucine-rich repeat surface protein [Mycoplasma capricolum]QIN42865.1 BspA family leucine-rich repeat surface protein [Mycoplasma capricolum subsp. capripneumoniae]QIN46294.1 BspA family leucine-rich repeat surface protein [Mycoplasma capricolum subsp. capripneumoniae]QIN50427.1 BspA family leucine-rich repeat surface protein [Mycoplasma capricolum subsp. capripneumoniae]
MKKLLTILSSLGLIATSSLFVISCKNNISRSDKENKENTNSDQKIEKPKRPATEEEKNKLQAIFKQQENGFAAFHTYKDVLDQLLVDAKEQELSDLRLEDGVNENESLKEDKNSTGKNIIKLKLYGSSVTFTPKKVLNNEVETIYSSDKKKVTQIGYKKNSDTDVQINKIQETITDVPKHLPLKVNSLKDAFSESKISKVENLDLWDTKNIKNMSSVFENASNFNQDLSKWNTENVTDMSAMFKDAIKFNQPLNKWKVNNVKDMDDMFADAKEFNQDLDKWEISGLANINQMFWDATNFNENITTWDISKVKSLYNTFAGASSFNQNISNWDTSNVTTMGGAFSRAKAFSQNLSNWNVKKVTATKNFNKEIQNTFREGKIPKFTITITY